MLRNHVLVAIYRPKHFSEREKTEKNPNSGSKNAMPGKKKKTRNSWISLLRLLDEDQSVLGKHVLKDRLKEIQ